MPKQGEKVNTRALGWRFWPLIHTAWEQGWRLGQQLPDGSQILMPALFSRI